MADNININGIQIPQLPTEDSPAGFEAIGYKSGRTSKVPLDTLATKVELQNTVVGTNLLGSKANVATIKSDITTPSKGDTYKATDTGHYWKYNDVISETNPYDPNKWVDIDIVIPSDVMLNGGTTKTGAQLDSEINKYPYKSGQEGSNISILKYAIKELFIYPEYLNPSLSYRIASVVRTSTLSQISLYSISSTGTKAQVDRLYEDADANNGSSKTYIGSRFSIVIDWGQIPLGSSFTEMFDGYELDSMCFSSSNPLSNVFNRLGNNYIYKATATGNNINFIRRAVKNLFIDPLIIETGKKYYLSAIRRNDNGATQLSVYSKRVSDGATSEIERISYTGDPANGSVQIIHGKTFSIAILWDGIPNGASYTGMFEGYDLDENCFSYSNYLYIGRVSLNSHKSQSLPQTIPLLFRGYIHKDSGALTDSPSFWSSDYIAVYPGQELIYVGNIYGNATICGYPSKSTNGYISLYTPSSSTNDPKNKIVRITIPEGIYFMRVCCYNNDTCILEWENKRALDTYYFDSMIGSGGQIEQTNLVAKSELVQARWIELGDNHCFPSKGIYIGLVDTDIVISIDGVIKKIEMQNRHISISQTDYNDLSVKDPNTIYYVY